MFKIFDFRSFFLCVQLFFIYTLQFTRYFIKFKLMSNWQKFKKLNQLNYFKLVNNNLVLKVKI